MKETLTPIAGNRQVSVLKSTNIHNVDLRQFSNYYLTEKIED